MPNHLSQHQRNLIYKGKYKKELETEPVIATIADEEFRLQHINIFADLPNRKKALKHAVNLMKEKEDWKNLPNLLQEMKIDGVNTNAWDIQHHIVNRVTLGGRQEALLESLRRVEDTGLRLNEPIFVIRVMLAIQKKALDSDWEGRETAQALKWAEMVVEMMEDEKHAGSRFLAGEDDPRLQLEVIGVLLELAAVRAVKHTESRDVDGKVAQYGGRLLGSPLEFKTTGEGEYELNSWLWGHVPILHGIYEALKVLDASSDIAEGLKTKSELLDSMVSTAYEKLADISSKKQTSEQTSLMGLQMHEKLLG